MDALSSAKMTALAAAQYATSVNENTKAQLQRHVEVLLALLKTKEVHSFLKNGEASRSCVTSLLEVLANCNKNKEAMSAIFKLFSVILDLPFSRKILFEHHDINTLLMKYVVERIEFESFDSMQECLRLLEKTTLDCRICVTSNYTDKFLQCLLDEITKDESKHATICLGILSNLITRNIAVQAQVKGILSSVNMKQLMNYLRKESIPNKISFLSVVTFVCWDDDLGKKFFSIKNVTETMKLIFSQLVTGEDLLTQKRASDICMELLKHDEVAQQISIYDSEHYIVYRLFTSLQKDAHSSSAANLLEVLLEFCQIKTIRHRLCMKLLEAASLWQVLLELAKAPLSKVDREPSMISLKLIGELCEEMSDSSIDFAEHPWFSHLLSVLTMQLVPVKGEDDSVLSMLLVNAELSKKLKAVEILNMFCTDEKLALLLVENINSNSMLELLQGQMSQNLLEVTQTESQDTTCLSTSVVLQLLDLARRLKSCNSSMENLLYSNLQDSRVIPFLAKAMTSCDRMQLQVALNLHQEASPLPNFPSVQLVETIGYLNEKQREDNSFRDGVLNYKSPFPASGSSVLQEKTLKNAANVKNSCRSSVTNGVGNDQDKENIESLIASLHNANEEEKNLDLRVPGKTSQIVTIYENKVSSLLTTKNHLQDLLEAKTLALSQADRIINQHRIQVAKSEEDARKMAEFFRSSESCCERLTETVKSLESDRATMERDLQTVVEENRSLQTIADHYDKMQVAFQDNLHKIEVLERNLSTVRQEYDTLKELHDMVQRHSEKLKEQHYQVTVRLEEIEEDRMKLLKRVSDLESSVSDLTQLVEEQDRAAQVLIREKNDRDHALKTTKTQLSKLEELTRDLKIKESHLSQSVLKKDEELSTLKQTLEKQSQTLSMITELANSKHRSK